jgi:hypothetical protein
MAGLAAAALLVGGCAPSGGRALSVAQPPEVFAPGSPAGARSVAAVPSQSAAAASLSAKMPASRSTSVPGAARTTPPPRVEVAAAAQGVPIMADDGAPTGREGGMSDATPAHAEVVTWQALQRPSVAGVEQVNRIQRVPAPDGPGRPDGKVLRFELRPGDTFDSNGYEASRVEVYGRHAASNAAPPEQWPDPVGSVRWYSFQLFVPADFVTATDSTWLTFMQWKGQQGGSPPIALEIKRDGLRLGGTRTNAGLIPDDGALGALTKGAWTHLVVGLSLSPDSQAGWVEVWRDGRLALPRVAVATMDRIGGHADPIYLKQGIYRDSSWNCTHVLYFGPVTTGSRRTDVP